MEASEIQVGKTYVGAKSKNRRTVTGIGDEFIPRWTSGKVIRLSSEGPTDGVTGVRYDQRNGRGALQVKGATAWLDTFAGLCSKEG